MIVEAFDTEMIVIAVLILWLSRAVPGHGIAPPNWLLNLSFSTTSLGTLPKVRFAINQHRFDHGEDRLDLICFVEVDATVEPRMCPRQI